MPGLGFQKQFADLVEGELKLQTMRAPRADGRDPKPGDRLYLWTGLRQKGARKLGEAICAETMELTLCGDRELVATSGLFHARYGPWPRCERVFAKAEGFEDWPAMFDWFDQNHGLPFTGLLIRWDRLLPREDWLR